MLSSIQMGRGNWIVSVKGPWYTFILLSSMPAELSPKRLYVSAPLSEYRSAWLQTPLFPLHQDAFGALQGFLMWCTYVDGSGGGRGEKKEDFPEGHILLMRRNNLQGLTSPILYKLPKCSIAPFQADSFSKHILGFFFKQQWVFNPISCS